MGAVYRLCPKKVRKLLRGQGKYWGGCGGRGVGWWGVKTMAYLSWSKFGAVLALAMAVYWCLTF